MAQFCQDIDQFLAVGQVAVIQTEPSRKDGPRFPTVFLGWRRDRAIFIEHPRTPDGRDVAFRDGQLCVLRFIHNGQACAFTTGVLDWSSARGESQVRLRWPEQLDTLVLRRFDRIPFAGSVRVFLANGVAIEGHFADLSLGGCGIVVKDPVEKGAILQLAFKLPDGAEISGLAVAVKMARQVADGCFLGCEIEPGHDAARNEIGLFVTTVLACSRSGAAKPENERRVLIVDSDPDRVENLRCQLARQSIEVLTTSSIVDAFHSVRAVPLHAVVICQDLSELPGLEICRLIRTARGLRELPLILYNGELSEEQIKDAGISRSLPASSSLFADIVYELRLIASNSKDR